MKILFIAAILLAVLPSHAAVPNTFQSGQPARAADVNQNFQALDLRLQDAITALNFPLAVATSDTGVATATCGGSALTFSIGATCSCSSVNGTRNPGLLNTCMIAGTQSAIAACSYDAGFFDPNKPAPRAIATATCVSGGTDGGVPYIPSDPKSGAAPVISEQELLGDLVRQRDILEERLRSPRK